MDLLQEILAYVTASTVVWGAALIIVFVTLLHRNPQVRKRALTSFVMAGTFLCAMWVLMKFMRYDDIKPAEANLLTMLLAICSGAFSWIASVVVSTQAQDSDRQNSLDEISVRSSEKILNSSKQLFDIETYIRGTAETRSGDRDVVFEVVLEAIERQIAQVRSTNDTLVRDWATVASSKIKDRIEGDIEEQSDLFHEARKAASDETTDDNFEQKLKKAPSYYAPSAPRKSGAGVVLQVERIDHKQDEADASGKLRVQIGRAAVSATVTGHFDRPVPGKAVSADAKLISVPSGTVDDFDIRARISGNLNDFPIHIYGKSRLVEPGEYLIEYRYKF